MAYTGYIYKITNKINGKSYIGKTNNIKRRWNEHKWGKGNTAILNKAFKKYGVDNFEFSLLEERKFKSINELNEILSQMEIDYIAKYNTFKKGYNATLGGEGTIGHFVSESTRRKFSILAKERCKSEEYRKKLSDTMKGKHLSPETKEKIKKALANRDPSVYKKIGLKLKGKPREHEMIMKAAAKRRKPILQYDKYGNFLKEYSGAIEIGYNTAANIIACCKGKISSAYGYIWRYKKEKDYPLHIDVSNNARAQFYKAVLQFSKEGKLIATYDSILKASLATDIKRRAISNCLYGWSKTAGGYIWKFKEEMEDVA